MASSISRREQISSDGVVVRRQFFREGKESLSDDGSRDRLPHRGIEGEINRWPDSASLMAGTRSVPKCDFAT